MNCHLLKFFIMIISLPSAGEGLYESEDLQVATFTPVQQRHEAASFAPMQHRHEVGAVEGDVDDLEEEGEEEKVEEELARLHASPVHSASKVRHSSQ